MNVCRPLRIAARLTIVLILSSPPGAAEEIGPGASELLGCQFDEAWDKNYDGWPDYWQRRIDDTYPGYVQIEIEDDPQATSGRSLFVHLRGGSAFFHSPLVPVRSLNSYLMTARARVEGVEHAHVSIGILWQTKDGRLVGEPTHVPLARSGQTQEIRVGPMTPADPAVEKAAVFVQIERGDQIDLDGVVVLEEARLVRLPQVILSPVQPLGLFADPNDVAVRCRLTGISSPDPRVRFELRSVEGELIDEKSETVPTMPIAPPEEAPSGGGPSVVRAEDFQGEFTWTPEGVGYGFYRVHATVLTDDEEGEKRTTSIAVLRPLPRPEHGVFGWSVHSVTDPHTTDDWARLLTEMGIHWVKFPIWYDPAKNDLGDELVQFTERLAAFGIEVVGVIDRPPQFDDGAARLVDAASVADIFTLDSSYWLPTLDPIMTRLSLRIRWWQFGDDRDTSLVGYPDLPALIDSVRRQLYRFGQKVNVGLPWKWMASPPERESLPWQFIQWSADPPLTGSELEANLEGTIQQDAQRWVLIDPLPRDTYGLSTRVTDLVRQMMAARISAADAAFLPGPVDSSRGILGDDGAPDELLLPFRTTAVLLADTQYLGSMRMPAQSLNHVFRKPDGSLLMVVWNSRAVTEELFLGEAIEHLDPWGREIALPGDTEGQAIHVAPVPSFVRGLDELATTVRITMSFEHERLPSVFGRPQANALEFVNGLSQGVGGTITPVSATGWEFAPDHLTFKSGAGALVRIPFQLSPRSDASSGRQEVRLDFEVQAAHEYKFSVWKHFDIGMGDIVVEVSTLLQEDGTLVVEQRTLNHTDQLVDFKCLLYAQNRRRQRNHIFRLGRGQDIQNYYLKDADDLIGTELWLRCEEIGGPRVFNYRFVVER